MQDVRGKRTDDEGSKGGCGEGPKEDDTGRPPGLHTAGFTRFSIRRSHDLEEQP
jgi:hypothetical protein